MKIFNFFKKNKHEIEHEIEPELEQIHGHISHIVFVPFKLRNNNILVVDDSSVNRYVLVKMIKIINAKFNIDEALSGIEALEKCKTKEYGIVFMDIVMPYMNGDIATEKIREFDKEVYVCGVTGQIEKSNMCLQKGMNLVLSKPVGLENLRSFFDNFV